MPLAASVPPQGDSVIDCFEVSAAEPFFSQGEPAVVVCHFLPPPFTLRESLGQLHIHTITSVSVSVSQCLTETATRGVAMVPKLALDVVSCEVLRVLQLSDSYIVPVSYHVPRKVSPDRPPTSNSFPLTFELYMQTPKVRCIYFELFLLILNV